MCDFLRLQDVRIQVLSEDSSTFPPILDLKRLSIFTSALVIKEMLFKQIAKDLVLLFNIHNITLHSTKCSLI